MNRDPLKLEQAGYMLQTEQEKFEMAILQLGDSSNSPACLQMYNLIEKKSGENNIPKHILYNVAWLETRYCGPFDWSYNPYRTSSAGAQGPMQIITRYAYPHAGRHVTAKELRTDLELNIDVSCSMLKNLYKTYGRWDLALGYYNTGYPGPPKPPLHLVYYWKVKTGIEQSQPNLKKIQIVTSGYIFR